MFIKSTSCTQEEQLMQIIIAPISSDQITSPTGWAIHELFSISLFRTNQSDVNDGARANKQSAARHARAHTSVKVKALKSWLTNTARKVQRSKPRSQSEIRKARKRNKQRWDLGKREGGRTTPVRVRNWSPSGWWARTRRKTTANQKRFQVILIQLRPRPSQKTAAESSRRTPPAPRRKPKRKYRALRKITMSSTTTANARKHA